MRHTAICFLCIAVSQAVCILAFILGASLEEILTVLLAFFAISLLYLFDG